MRPLRRAAERLLFFARASFRYSRATVARRSPKLVWRFITIDVWRLLLLTTTVLVTVLSFAAAVRFLADGRLGPLETVRFMLLAMPPMLQYALPFAAGFGATLAYHRWCSDNEVTACFAAGIGHRSLLAPMLISGLVLGGVIFTLQNEIIPRFLRSMEQLITRDAARYIIGSIERKDAVKLNDTLFYADLVRTVPRTDSGTGPAYEQLYMKRLMVVKLDANKQPELEVSAEEADVWLVREDASALATPGPGQPPATTSANIGADSVTRVIVKPRGVRARSIGKQGSEVEYTVMSYVIPNAFNDDPKFLTWRELQRLKAAPDGINFIESRRRVLASHICERLTTDQLNRDLRDGGEVRLLDRNEQPLVLRGGSIEWDPKDEYWTIKPRAGEKDAAVQVVRTLDSGRTLIQTAESARLRTAVNPTAPDDPVTLVIQLAGVRTDTGSGAARRATTGGTLKEFTLDNVTLASAPAASIMKLSSAELLPLADQRVAAANGVDDYVAKPASDLRRRLLDLSREIMSKQHERLASSVACTIMIITGAVMAMRLRSKLPLTVYLWAFFPALFAVITISAGQQTTHHNGPWGLLVLWGGVAALIVYTAMQYRKVAVH